MDPLFTIRSSQRRLPLNPSNSSNPPNPPNPPNRGDRTRSADRQAAPHSFGGRLLDTSNPLPKVRFSSEGLETSWSDVSDSDGEYGESTEVTSSSLDELFGGSFHISEVSEMSPWNPAFEASPQRTRTKQCPLLKRPTITQLMHREIEAIAPRTKEHGQFVPPKRFVDANSGKVLTNSYDEITREVIRKNVFDKGHIYKCDHAALTNWIQELSEEFGECMDQKDFNKIVRAHSLTLFQIEEASTNRGRGFDSKEPGTCPIMVGPVVSKLAGLPDVFETEDFFLNWNEISRRRDQDERYAKVSAFLIDNYGVFNSSKGQLDLSVSMPLTRIEQETVNRFCYERRLNLLSSIYNGDVKQLEKYLADCKEHLSRQTLSDLLNARDKDGLTLLMHAVLAANANPRVVKLLLNYGAFHDAVNGQDKNALHFAAHQQRADLAEVLLDRSAEKHGFTSSKHEAFANSRDIYGNTPLWRTLMSKREHVSGNLVELLLIHGADVNANNDTGTSPKKVTKILGHRNALQTIEEALAE